MKRKVIEIGQGNYVCVIAYVVYKKAVYFTKIGGVRSSINSAEYIVEAIAKSEGIDWESIPWIDVQTVEFYSRYSVDKLVFAGHGDLSVIGWKPTKLPKKASLVLFG